MPGPESVDYLAAAAATTNVVAVANATANSQFTPGALPQPVIDNVGIKNGQYFLLTDQTDPNQNGLWFADPSGPVAVPGATNGGPGGINPNISIQVLPGNPGSQNGGTIWGYTPQWRNTGNTPGFQLLK